MTNISVNSSTAILAAIERQPLANGTKKQYRHAIQQALADGVNLSDSVSLRTYAAKLKNSRRACLKAAIRLWAGELANQIKSEASPENVATVQAAVYRLEALSASVRVEASRGQRAHTWLTKGEVQRLFATCDDTTRGLRDRIVLGLLVGAALRREELAALRFKDIEQLPARGKNRAALNIRGKGAKHRTVPISEELAALVSAWRTEAGPGRVARSIAKNGAIGDSLSSVGIFYIVRGAGQAIGKPALAPHDLRRTFAQLGYEAGVPITQISKLLGHSSITTTQRYLNLDLNLSETVSDFVKLG